LDSTNRGLPIFGPDVRFLMFVSSIRRVAESDMRQYRRSGCPTSIIWKHEVIPDDG